MLRISLRSLLAHRLRLALTALAVALGVSFVAGTFILSDTMGKAFDQLYAGLSQGTDVTVRATAAFSGDPSFIGKPIDASVLSTVRGVDGVAAAEGGLTGYALVIGKDGKPVQPGGAPTLASGYSKDRDLAGGFVLRSGTAPSSPNDVVLDAGTVKKGGYQLGDTVPVVFTSGRGEFHLVGISGFGKQDNLLGATLATFATPTAQQYLGLDGKYTQIAVRAAAGVSAEQLQARIAKVLPHGTEAVTSADLTQQQSKQTRDALQFFTTFLLVFAVVSLVVGAFLIWNTFSVLVAQRTRETALLRAVGAKRSQVMGGLVVEALIVGIVSSAAGLGVGIGLAAGLRALLGAIGVDLPTTSMAIETRTVVVTFAVGVLVTLVSAVLPARRATKVPPIAALREATPAEKAPSRWRTLVGCVLTALGVAGLVGGALGEQLPLVGLGTTASFVGLVVLGPDLARLTAGLVRGGKPTGWGMAARTVARSPRRSATTALALTIGLALVSAVTVTAASTKASVSDLLDTSSNADLILKSSSQTSGGFTPKAADALRSVQGVDRVAELRFGQVQVKGATTAMAGLSSDADTVVDLGVSSGRWSDLQDGTVAVSKAMATTQKIAVGDRLPVTFAETGPTTLKVVAVFDNDALIGAGYLVTLSEWGAHTTNPLDMAVLATAKQGANAAAVRTAAQQALAAYPGIAVDDPATFAKDSAKSVDQLLGLVTALLLLAVIVALLGIVNTLALSVLERTRELGLLRAVGAQRRQVTGLVRRESVLMAALGAVIGILLGTGAGVALARGLADLGLSVVAVPWARLAAYLVAAMLAGVLAAVGPGRRAARVDVLRAVTAD